MDRTMAIVYPVARLLANPKVFCAIANYLGGPDAETLRESFYDLLEFSFEEEDDEDCNFYAEEVCFESEEGGMVYNIILDTGLANRLEASQGEVRTEIKNEKELAAAMVINRRLISAIEEVHPEFKDDISLEHPPTPSNGFLGSERGDQFEGTFHLRSDPEKRYSFAILVVDPELNKLEAKTRPCE